MSRIDPKQCVGCGGVGEYSANCPTTSKIELVEYVAIRIWMMGTPLKPGPWNDAQQLWERADERDKRIARLQAQVAIDAVLAVTPIMITHGQ